MNIQHFIVLSFLYSVSVQIAANSNERVFILPMSNVVHEIGVVNFDGNFVKLTGFKESRGRPAESYSYNCDVHFDLVNNNNLKQTIIKYNNGYIIQENLHALYLLLYYNGNNVYYIYLGNHDYKQFIRKFKLNIRLIKQLKQQIINEKVLQCNIDIYRFNDSISLCNSVDIYYSNNVEMFQLIDSWVDVPDGDNEILLFNTILASNIIYSIKLKESICGRQ